MDGELLLNDGSSSAAYTKRPVSMFEHTSKAPQMPESRAANSMYQIIDGMKPPISTSNDDTSLETSPRAEIVKYLTDSVTRRIQELWTAMQDMTSNNAYIPCAERIKEAVADLTAVFPAVSSKWCIVQQ